MAAAQRPACPASQSRHNSSPACMPHQRAPTCTPLAVTSPARHHPCLLWHSSRICGGTSVHLQRIRTSRHIHVTGRSPQAVYAAESVHATSSVPSSSASASSQASTSVSNPSSSQQQRGPPRAPSWFDQLSETQRYVLADEWGFTLVGTSLPAGVPMKGLSFALPPDCLQPNLTKALIGIAIPLAVMAAGYGWLWYMHSITPWWQWLACWMGIGTAYMGLFQVAHECARGAYLPQYPKSQAVLGALLMAPALYSLDTWRARAYNHGFMLNQLQGDDTAWHPVTVGDVAAAGPVRRALLRLFTSTPLKLLGTLWGWCRSLEKWDLFSYYDELRKGILLSWIPPAAWLGLAVPAIMACAGGLTGLFNLWIAPLLVFHLWLSTITLLHHTAPQIPWRSVYQHDLARAVVSGTVTVQLPRWLETLLNYPNYNLPQHLVFDGVPCYNARAATEALRERLWPYMHEAPLSIKLLTNHITKWQVYDPEAEQYITFEQAVARADAAQAGQVAADSNGHAAPAAAQ